MPEVPVDVAGRNYRLVCGEGEEKHLLELVALIDCEARELSKGRGAQMAEGRLMLMSALMVADRLHDALGRIEALEGEVATGGGTDPAREEEIAGRIASLADRAERLVAAAE